MSDALRPADAGPLVRKAPDAPALKSELALPGMRIGLFGGSFNPVHDGHLHVAREAMRRLKLDRVWWLVSPQNPLKPAAETSDFAKRFAGVERIAAEPRFVVSDVERRLGASYTAATIAALAARHPKARFVWIMGADNLQGFHRWRDWAGIMNTVPVAVIARPSDPIRARLSIAAQRFRTARVSSRDAAALVETPAPAWLYLNVRYHPASSTALRARSS